jgi:hypothetical protein
MRACGVLAPGQTSIPDSTCLEPVPPDAIVRSPSRSWASFERAWRIQDTTVKNPDGQTATSTFLQTPAPPAPRRCFDLTRHGDLLGNTVVHRGNGLRARRRVTFGRAGKGVSGTVTSVSSDGTTIDACSPPASTGRSM